MAKERWCQVLSFGKRGEPGRVIRARKKGGRNTGGDFDAEGIFATGRRRDPCEGLRKRHV